MVGQLKMDYHWKMTGPVLAAARWLRALEQAIAINNPLDVSRKEKEFRALNDDFKKVVLVELLNHTPKITKGVREELALLLSWGMDVNTVLQDETSSFTLLSWATRRGEWDLCHDALDHGANVPRSDAFLYDLLSGLKMVSEKNEDEDDSRLSDTPFLAAQRQTERQAHLDKAKSLGERFFKAMGGGFLSHEKKQRLTSMKLAIYGVHIWLVELLIKQGAFLNHRDYPMGIDTADRTPVLEMLMTASGNDEKNRDDLTQMALMLLEKGADPDEQAHGLNTTVWEWATKMASHKPEGSNAMHIRDVVNAWREASLLNKSVLTLQVEQPQPATLLQNDVEPLPELRAALGSAMPPVAPSSTYSSRVSRTKGL